MIEAIKPKGERRIVSLDEAVRRVRALDGDVEETLVEPKKKSWFSFLNRDKDAWRKINSLLFQPEVDTSGTDYFKSESELESEGYRHMRPDELFSLILVNKEKPFKGKRKKLFNAITEDSVWLDLFLYSESSESNKYALHKGVTGSFVKKDYGYQAREDFHSEQKIEFELTRRFRNTWRDIQDFPEGVLEFIFPEGIYDLPRMIKNEEISSLFVVPGFGAGFFPICYQPAAKRFCIKACRPDDRRPWHISYGVKDID